jgi:hypothetical protein
MSKGSHKSLIIVCNHKYNGCLLANSCQCDECKKTTNLTFSSMAKLVIALLSNPFMKWGLGFIGLVKPIGKHTWNKHVFVVTCYTTKWVDARTLHSTMMVVTAKFLYECILIKFGCPLTLVSDEGMHFINDTISHLVNHSFYCHTTSTTYYPQGNRHA